MLGYLAIHDRPCFYNPPTPHQKTPLHVAAERGHVDTVRYLADQAADINIKDSWSGVSEY